MRRSPHYAMLLAALLFAGCKSSKDPTPKPGVALFVNTLYVDYTDIVSPGYADEARNVYEHLATVIPVTTFTGTTSTEISAAVAGQAVLAIPEQENGSLISALDTAARNAIEGFVAAGGTLIIFDADYNTTTLLNGVFGFATSYTSFYTETLNTSAAAGTPFAGGPTSLSYNNATAALVSSSLPSGALKIYADSYGNSGVVLIPHGAGSIVVLGWDWYAAVPLGTLDGGWIDVLDRALSL